jgi:probable rRNA maturation factor
LFETEDPSINISNMPHGPDIRENTSERFRVTVSNEQSSHPINRRRLMEAVRLVLGGTKLKSATISLAIVDDETIHDLNRRFLAHDYPTDVLSFVLDEQDGHLEGEIVLSADTAAAEARDVGWAAADEQLLYVIHGTLHLIGLCDGSESESRQMRAAEEFYLRECGVALPSLGPLASEERTASQPAGGQGGTSAR